MLTTAAAASADLLADVGTGAFLPADLLALGVSRSALAAQVAAARWQRVGRVIVTHNSALTRAEARHAAVLNCGPRAVLASFTALESHGLRGWERPELVVQTPPGVARPSVPELPIVVHRSRHAEPGARSGTVRRQGVAAAAVLVRETRVRHRAVLCLAVADIAMGAEALSEIDFVRLCRRHRMPAPRQQAVRVQRDGLRRYLDAEWVRTDGRIVVVEVDGALHLSPRRWFDDQLQQNELVISGSLVLRFPSVVVRTDECLVADQLRRLVLA